MANQAVVGIDDILKGFDLLKEQREPIARAMGWAMATTVRDEAIKRAPELKPGDEGWDSQRAGQLKEAMYAAFDGRRSVLNAGHYVYGVSWNARKAPHGHLVEFGHFMEYQSYEDAEHGLWFTPIVGSRKVGGRKRGVGYVRPNGGFYVNTHPFLAPAFDSKLHKLNTIAAAAGAAVFGQYH